ncbi:DNA photolyase family protein [Flavobacteriaceae bacterium]|nr:DNA photolyase family protein [Flavobacteriaceae bacterium]MDB4851130.1 DNA photolyase family protein [Flavobacteriaceae bacterium]
MDKISIFWFRRDLRLHDNVALFNALKSGEKVLPIFIFDTSILDKLPKNDARVSFIIKELRSMNEHLKSFDASIDIYHGKPIEVFESLIKKYPIASVFTNHDYEPYAIKRDQEIKELLSSENINFNSFKDQVIFEKNEITKKDGNPYVVYTPYSKKWMEAYEQINHTHYTSEDLLSQLYTQSKAKELTLEELGFEETNTPIKNYIFNSRIINEYEETRNFPALDNTSKLGPHLRFGTVSVRQMVSRAEEQENKTFLKELIWREFFMQILWHFPHTHKDSFKPKYDRIIWRNNEDDFKKWCNGTTGYPMVDAGMRQLNNTGFMHNRVRMLVGSFLCKHLLIDWRWGEAYFAEKLHDYEMSSNVGNWQWVAGTGVDASPYFRIFNPTSQIKKFDKDFSYIKKWVPDFQELTYPSPMVDHKFARERCLKTYKEALA